MDRYFVADWLLVGIAVVAVDEEKQRMNPEVSKVLVVVVAVVENEDKTYRN